MARVQGISEQFRIARQSTLAETQRIVVAVAKREHGRVMQTDPRPASFRRFVDGREGAPEEAVRGNGVILYQYPRLDIVGEFAVETLIAKSPVGPPEGGHYRDRHQRFVNGAPVGSFAGYPSGAELAISNSAPYSRKIELGRMHMRVPGTDHVYEQARQVVNARYGTLARVRFGFMEVGGGQRNPALVITER